MKTASKWAAEIDEALNLARGDEEFLTKAFAACQAEVRRATIEECAMFVEESDEHKPLDVIADNLRTILADSDKTGWCWCCDR